MPIKITSLSISKGPDVDPTGSSYAHSFERSQICYWRNQNVTCAFKSNEPTVE